jgi:hypothetical protein
MANNQHAAKLTRNQKLELKTTLQQPPSDQGLPKEFWDVPTIKEYVSAEFGVVYESVQSYHYLSVLAAYASSTQRSLIFIGMRQLSRKELRQLVERLSRC